MSALPMCGSPVSGGFIHRGLNGVSMGAAHCFQTPHLFEAMGLKEEILPEKRDEALMLGELDKYSRLSMSKSRTKWKTKRGEVLAAPYSSLVIP